MADDKEAATAIRQLNHCQFRGQSITVHKSHPTAVDLAEAADGRARGGAGTLHPGSCAAPVRPWPVWPGAGFLNNGTNVCLALPIAMKKRGKS